MTQIMQGQSSLKSVHKLVDSAGLTGTAKFEKTGGLVLVRELDGLSAEQITQLQGVLLFLVLSVTPDVNAARLQAAVRRDHVIAVQVTCR